MRNTYLPEYEFRVAGFMQQAVESSTCPHFVTGSARKSTCSRGGIGSLDRTEQMVDKRLR
ncbi:MAG: hypothetical protein GY801_23075 [bacterium]|nr:hypothetical protein [bacterium]